jgi:hypothetical protein
MILPQLLGWTDVVAAQSAPESHFLAQLVGLHVATALALVVFHRDTWARIIPRRQNPAAIARSRQVANERGNGTDGVPWRPRASASAPRRRVVRRASPPR